MSNRPLITAIVALAITLFAQGSVAADRALLLIRVNGLRLNNVGKPVEGAPLFSFKLMNVQTGKFATHAHPDRVAAFELEEGIYCLASVSLFSNFSSTYCGEPYFRVVAGKINNAGTWYYGFAVQDRIAKLVSSMERLDATLQEAERYEAELLAKYGHALPK